MKFPLSVRRIKLVIVLAFGFAIFCVCFYRPLGVVNGRVAGDSLSSPGALTASDGDYATKVGLHWEPVRGATIYRIFRNVTNTSSTAIDVGATPANYFFDTSATAGQQYFYWVRGENSQTSSGFSNSDQGIRAVGDNNPGPPFPPLQPPITPSGNPVTASKAYLGKTLFWDEQLSSTKTVSCGTCHRPARGGSDPRTSASTRNPGFDGAFATADDIFGSPGVPLNYSDGNYGMSGLFGMGLQVTGRKSPSYLNAGYSDLGLFWDGRANDVFRDPITNAIILGTNGSLESQSIFPPISDAEMGHSGRDWPQVAARVSASRPLALAQNIPAGLSSWIDGRTYAELFEEAFGSPGITPARIALAIGTHERTLFSDRTPLDKSAAGIAPLTAQEDAGRNLFVTLNCNFCHGGPLMSDQSFNNVGVRPQVEDRGRGAITGFPVDDARFKTPSLRNLELRAPYMHNGRFATVEDVVEFYNRGGDFDAPNIDHTRIRPRNLSPQQKADLAAFLKRPLTDDRVKLELPPFDRPQLFTESNRVPVVSGSGRAGSGAFEPNPIAIEPPMVGNPSFTVGVSNALGGAPAVVVIDSADPGVGPSIPGSGSFARVNVSLAGGGAGNGYGSANLSIPNNPALIGQTFYGRWYVTDAGATNGFSVSRLFQFTIFGSAAVQHAVPFDFDGDRKTDIGIFRPAGAASEWWINRSSNGQTFALQFGAQTDRITPADFTGDGKADIAFFRPASGEWYVLRSEDFSFFALPFGTNGDVPVPGDYDADSKADFAVFRPSTSTWFISQSSGAATRILQFGITGDQPVVADYDGDGKADVGIFRQNGPLAEWWINRSTAGLLAMQFGSSTDKAVQGDYTGDGKADVAIWRPATGQWFIVRSEDSSFYGFPFGATGDVPASGDYDGDGKFDATVFRASSSTWFIGRTTAGTQIVQFGAAGDRPIPNAFVP
ncbi:MAG TPA: cytochrome c peroxidase [Pyrinomonadaceae bacterium]|nr:cytochrome c peroxidase [Pyrinomonadaceae bacterium]